MLCIALFYFLSEVIVHPSYKFTPQADRYDVALLKLDRPATMMPHISPVCLPPTSERVPLGNLKISVSVQVRKD